MFRRAVFASFADAQPDDVAKYTQLEDMPVAMLADKALWEKFAFYICNVHLQASGDPLASTTAVNYFQCCMQIAKEKVLVPETAADHVAKLFFVEALGESTQANACRSWWQGLKANLTRLMMQHEIEDAGSVIDNSAVPLYYEHINAATNHLAGQRGADAIARRATILLTWQASGRTGEATFVQWAGMSWDSHMGCVFAKVPQTKVSKIKLCALCCAFDRNMCWLKAMGDMFATTQRENTRLDLGVMSAAWVLPHLHEVAAPGAKVSSYIKQLVTAVPSLPIGATGAGIRVGLVNSFIMVMPHEHAMAATRHDQTNSSAFFEYAKVYAIRALLGPGTRVIGALVGSNQVHMVRLVKLRVPHQQPVIDSNGGPSQQQFDAMVDDLYTINSITIPTLRGGGALREMVLTFLASQLMWFKETSENGEVQGVLQRMVAVYKKVFTGVYAGGNVTKN